MTPLPSSASGTIRKVFFLAVLAVVSLSGRCVVVSDATPPGAAILGYTRALILEQPIADDVTYAKNGPYKWFSGQWYTQYRPSMKHYTSDSGVLAVTLGGDIVSTPLDFSEGKLPLLSGRTGFYVEFDVRLSDNDPDHWPAVWLMPAEHNAKKHDHDPVDPPEFQRWVEIDVDEGGFGPGLAGTVHCWSGIYPKYQHNWQNGNNISPKKLDRTKEHSFGASYAPAQNRVTWWVDGLQQMSTELPCKYAMRHNFYLIISAQSHGKNMPYSMFIRRVRAFVPSD